MKKLLVVGMVVGLLGLMAGTVMAASTDSANVNLLVTPVVLTSLTVSPTYYDFGNVDVKASTCSVSALTLTNDGTIGILIDKTLWAQDGWRIDYSSTAQDGFDLWAMVGDNQPGQATFETALSSFNETGLYALNALTEGSGTQVDMDPLDTESIWFRLDMPGTVTETRQQLLHVRLRATAK